MIEEKRQLAQRPEQALPRPKQPQEKSQLAQQPEQALPRPEQPQQQQSPRRASQQRRRLPPAVRTASASASTTTAGGGGEGGPAKTFAPVRVSSDVSADEAVMPGAIAVRGSSAIYQDSDSDDDDDENDNDEQDEGETVKGPGYACHRHLSSNRRLNGANHAVQSGIDFAGGDDVAIAVEVNEQEELDAADRMVAVEFDPDAKPPRFVKTKLFRRCALIFMISTIFIAAATIAGIVISFNSSGGGDSDDAERLYRESLGIREEIVKVIGADKLESPSTSSESTSSPQLLSPYAKAMEWIIHQDPLQLVPGDANLIQRYIVAYLYFSTTAMGPWRSCNPPVGDERNDCYYAQKIKIVYTNKEVVYEDVQAIRWLTALHECQFAGVDCDQNMQIVELALSEYNLIYSDFGQDTYFAPPSCTDERATA
jgi:hypothetical protein